MIYQEQFKQRESIKNKEEQVMKFLAIFKDI